MNEMYDFIIFIFKNMCIKLHTCLKLVNILWSLYNNQYKQCYGCHIEVFKCPFVANLLLLRFTRFFLKISNLIWGTPIGGQVPGNMVYWVLRVSVFQRPLNQAPPSQAWRLSTCWSRCSFTTRRTPGCNRSRGLTVITLRLFSRVGTCFLLWYPGPWYSGTLDSGTGVL